MTALVRAAEGPRDAWRDEFDSYDHRPKLVVDHDGSVLWACANAARILAGSAMPLCIRKGKLILDEDELRGEFIEFLRDAGPQPARKLIRSKTKRQWAVVRAWKPDHWTRAVCLLASPSAPLEDIVASGLAGALKLTKAEVRVLREFAELSAPKQIAHDLGVSLSTVRSHLKQIHTKASVATSMQLLRLTHTFCSA
jgi:DNA-binding CsgD family transcriptional regulator